MGLRLDVSEIVAAGLLSEIFLDLEHIKEKRNVKTPDFKIEDKIFVEVYCPQKSQPELEKGNQKLLNQQGHDEGLEYIYKILSCVFKEEQSSYEKEYRITVHEF